MKDKVTTNQQPPTENVPVVKPVRRESVYRRLFSLDSFADHSEDLSLLASLPAFSEHEVHLHSSPDDCWIIINEFVYDVTDFIRRHPGGSEILWEHLGHDATLAFIGTGHSKAAYRMLDKFLIGTVQSETK